MTIPTYLAHMIRLAIVLTPVADNRSVRYAMSCDGNCTGGCRNGCGSNGMSN